MYYIGIDLGGMSIKAGIVDENGSILSHGKVPTGRERHHSLILEDMAKLCRQLLNDAGLTETDIYSIGVGSPGIPDKKRGVLIRSNNLNFINVPIKDELQKYFNLDVYLDNDANAAALAESIAGASMNTDHSVLITLGTGIGGGVIIDKRIYSGFNDAGSELGHMCIVYGGIQCSCGRKGCFEKYASASALIEQTKEAFAADPDSAIGSVCNYDAEKIDARTAFLARDMGDKTAAKVVDQYVEYLAEGCMNIVNMLFPEVIVIGGGVGNEGENLFEPLRIAMRKRAYTLDVPETKIRGAKMENRAGIVGAAMLGRKI
ncbi:MAG: ROK family protein [Clostridia bacterium]|nr:ROK family protein [Clostridia bacterium]MBN2883030.1 ROK family protein [Clostridia bacterium]